MTPCSPAYPRPRVDRDDLPAALGTSPGRDHSCSMQWHNETSTIRDPLVLHFAFAKPQPFVIAWSLDSTEFAAIVDFVHHHTVHESLDNAASGSYVWLANFHGDR